MLARRTPLQHCGERGSQRLGGQARSACLQREFARAAQFIDASDRLFCLLAKALSPIEQSWREKDLGSARKSLGDEQFQTLWQKSYALSPEQVIAYASGEEG
jgi:hypothetical protein